ncbi:MAG: class I tRNA ligase family protein [Acidobacteriota bacterium]
MTFSAVRPHSKVVRRLDPASFVHAYNVDLQMIYPWQGVVDEPPFGAAWAVLAPGESTQANAHQELESFFIFRGAGRMQVGDDRFEVSPGDVTFHRPFDNHRLTNPSDSEELVFLTVWWEDRATWTGKGAAGLGAAGLGAAGLGANEETPAAIDRALVTAAPPTPNGDLHLGHLSGPYLAGDVHARFLRLRGIDATFVTGSDDYSIFVEAEGRRIDRDPAATADLYATAIEETLQAAGIDLAAFPSPQRSDHHITTVQSFVRDLWKAGHLEERLTECPWCPHCDRYLWEAFLKGSCPHCKSAMVGHTCEDCGRVHDGPDLLDPACNLCGATPIRVPISRLVFPLSRHSETLRTHLRTVSMGGRLASFCAAILADGLPDLAVTHPTDWGIEVPIDGWEDHRIYVWLEMAPRYIAYSKEVLTARGEPADAWTTHWKSDSGRVVQCFGFDNSFYYALFIPALLKAWDPELQLPAAYLNNEFYRLANLKFSTSRGHRILARDLLAEAPRDAVRYYLARTAPEREETDFTLEEFRQALDDELAGHWQSWLDGVAERATRLGSKVPGAGEWTLEQRRFYRRLEALVEDAAGAWGDETFSPQRAVVVMSEIVREGRRFGQGQTEWAEVPSRSEEWRTAVALELLAVKVLGLVAAPLMPETAERLWRTLGYGAGPAEGSWQAALDWVPTGQQLGDFHQEVIASLTDYLQSDTPPSAPLPDQGTDPEGIAPHSERGLLRPARPPPDSDAPQKGFQGDGSMPVQQLRPPPLWG